MLTAADVAGFDVPGLAARLAAAALHQDRCRRRAVKIGMPADAMHTRLAVVAMDEHAEAIAEGARFVALVGRLVLDEPARRPAPVLRLVPQAEPSPPRTSRRLPRFLAALWPAREVA